MKKILFILFILFSIGCNAQIYNTIKHYDKFDDIIKTEKIKTLVNKTDSTFVFETKNRNNKVYYILDIVHSNCIGDSKIYNHEKLLENGNIYGYQEYWLVTDLRYDEYFDLVLTNKTFADSHTFGLCHRVISRYSFEFYFETEFHWIQKFDGSRIIYSNE